MADRFPAMDLQDAQRECVNHRTIYERDKCPTCKLAVLLHCSDCKIQITGCLCVEQDRFGQDEAWLRAVDRYGEEMARERMRKAGFWTPEVS